MWIRNQIKPELTDDFWVSSNLRVCKSISESDLEGMAREQLIHSFKALHSIASNQVGKRRRYGRGQDHEIQWSHHILLHPEAANLLE